MLLNVVSSFRPPPLSENLTNLSKSREALIDHLVANSVRTDGPFTLRSGQVSDFYIDARQTTFDGEGAALVGAAVCEVVLPEVVAVGGLTMGADPIAVATAMASTDRGAPLKAFSIRKTVKDHGTGGRLVGPVVAGDVVAIIDDTVTTGGALIEAVEVARAGGLRVVQAVCLVDRSEGLLGRKLDDLGIPYVALVAPLDLGVAP